MPELNPREVNTLLHAMEELTKPLREDEHADPKVKDAVTGVAQLLSYISNCLVWEATRPASSAPNGAGHHQPPEDHSGN